MDVDEPAAGDRDFTPPPSIELGGDLVRREFVAAAILRRPGFVLVLDVERCLVAEPQVRGVRLGSWYRQSAVPGERFAVLRGNKPARFEGTPSGDSPDLKRGADAAGSSSQPAAVSSTAGPRPSYSFPRTSR